MVSTTDVKENGVETTTTTTTTTTATPTPTPTPPCQLPPGKYRLVGFDLDLTGRRLIDEICHIAAYTPNTQFSQYVMPFRNINVASRKRHMLRVVTIGRYRMLRSIKTGKVLKTKSEISAVTDFVQWLEDLKAEGVILITHDSTKTVPPFLLEVIRKYKLYDRFSAVVKGFANSFVFSEQKCARIVKSHSLQTLSQVLLDNNEDLVSAAERARLSYQIVQHLCSGEDDKGSGDASSSAEIDNPAMSEAIRQVATTMEDEEKELAKLKELVERQDGLRPIFGHMIKSKILTERNRANNLRRLIAQANLSYENLVEAWEKNKKESLTALVKERITNVKKPEELDELTATLLRHFDPELAAAVPQRRWVKRYYRVTNKENKAGQEAKDATTGDKGSKSSSPAKVASVESSPTNADGGKVDADTSR